MPFRALRILLLLLLLLPCSGAHAADTWLSQFKNSHNNAYLNHPAAAGTITTGSQNWTTPNEKIAANAGLVIAGPLDPANIQSLRFYAVSQDDGGTPYDADDDQIRVVGFNVRTGKLMWRSKALAVGNAVSWGSTSTPTLDSDDLYFASGDTVVKLRPMYNGPATSIRLTSATTHNAASSYEVINSSPAVGRDKVFIETYGGFGKTEKQIVALNKSDLKVAWAVKDGGLGNGTPCLVDDGTSQSVCTATAHNVNCYDARDGGVRWQGLTLGGQAAALSYTIAASLVYDGGNLIVTSEDFSSPKGEIVCVDARTGAIKWSQIKVIEWVSAPPVVAGDRIYVTGGPGHSIWCLNLADGATIWKKSYSDHTAWGTAGAIPLTVTANRIYTTDGDSLLVLDTSGNLISRVANGSYAGPVAIDSTGVVYAHAGQSIQSFGRIAGAAVQPGTWGGYE